MPPITYETPELQGNEVLKGFANTDDLGKAYLDLQGKVSSASIEILPEEVRKDPTVAKYKTVTDLAKGHVEATKLIGTIKKPPAQVTDYKFNAIENLHPNLKANEDFQKYLAGEVYKLGLSSDQADGVHRAAMNYLSGLYTKADQIKEENFKRNDTALRAEWGADYEKKFNNVVRVLSKASGKTNLAELGLDLKNAPVALKAFGKIADLLSEDSVNSLGEGGAGAGNEGDSDEKAYQEMRKAIETNDQKSAIMNERDPKHQDAVKRYKELSEKHFTRK